jgi:hypothetical protein
MRGATRDDGVPLPRAHVVLLAAIGGMALGALVLLADLPAWDDDEVEVARTGAFGLWATAIALQTTAWVLAVPAIRAVARRWRTRAAARSTEIVVATAAIVVVGVLIAVVPPAQGPVPDTIPNRRLKTGVLNAGAFLVAAYAVRALLYVVAQVRDLRTGEAGGLDALRRHQRLRADLQLLLGILGTLVSLAVIAAAALRALTVEVDPDTALPAESVVTYGIVLSLLLALIYVPAYMTLLRAGRALQDELAPMLPVGDPGFGERLDLRDRLAGLLALDVSASVSFRSGGAILSPLLGSLTSLLPSLA